MLGNCYVVMSGLQDGEEIVTQGAFSVDASAQLAGKPSMMNTEGGKISTMPDMDMLNDNKSKTNKSKSEMDMLLSPKHDQNFKTAVFHVSGNCEMCKNRIEKAAKSVKGVSTAVWDVKTKKIQVEYNKAVCKFENIQKAIANAGHDTNKFKAPDDIYKLLPKCCLYR